MANKAMEIYNGLPGYARAVVIIGGGLIAWFGVVNPIRRVIVSKLNQTKMVKEGNEAKQTLNDLAKKGVKPTITDAQAQSFCNALVSSFDGCGTDENAVYSVMSQLKNDADVYKLIASYGVRKYDACGVGTGDTEGSLSYALSDELDFLEKSNVNAILKKNGVTFQFS